MLFNEVIGQEPAKAKLRMMVKTGRISHAQLFTGLQGSGQLPLALAFASYILCEKSVDGDACGKCPACNKTSKLIHPDMHFVMPVNTNKRVTRKPSSDQFMEEWREAIMENPYITLENWLLKLGIENKQAIINVQQSNELTAKLALKSFEGGYKIVIIWLPEKMNVMAANKLLKTLEEPEKETLFLLVADDIGNLLPTILSRLQMLKLERLSEEQIATVIKKEYKVSDDVAARVAGMSDGNYSEALQFMEKTNTFENQLEEFIQWMRCCFAIKSSMKNLLEWIDHISSTGREKQMLFLHFCLHMVEQCIWINYKIDDVRYNMQSEDRKFLEKFAPFINEANRNEISTLFNDGIGHIQRNAYPKLLFMDMSIRISRLLKRGKQELQKGELT